jgi:hypothetical protein
MKHKEQFVMDVQEATKVARTLIRLKHSLAADEEINNRVPALVELMNDRAVTGKAYKTTVNSLLAELAAE